MNKIDKKIVGYKIVTPESKEILTTQGDSLRSETSLFKAHAGKTLVGKVCYVGDTLEELANETTTRTVRAIDETGYRVEEEGSIWDGKVWKYAKEKQTSYAKVDLKRPLALESRTWRLKPPQAEHALYITLSATLVNGRKFPFEIFFNTKNPAHIEWTSSLTLTLSIAFRTAIETNTSLAGLIENLKETFGTSGSYLSKVPKKPKFVNGLVGEIGLVIEEFNNECLQSNYSNSSHEVKPTAEEFASVSKFEEASPNTVTNSCPDCGTGMRISEGCLVCPACAYSKCG